MFQRQTFPFCIHFFLKTLSTNVYIVYVKVLRNLSPTIENKTPLCTDIKKKDPTITCLTHTPSHNQISDDTKCLRHCQKIFLLPVGNLSRYASPAFPLTAVNHSESKWNLTPDGLKTHTRALCYVAFSLDRPLRVSMKKDSERGRQHLQLMRTL